MPPDVHNRFRSAALAGGLWFLKHENRAFLSYRYDPLKRRHPKKQHPLREMGALWAIARLDRAFPERGFRPLAEKGFRHFSRWFRKEKGTLHVRPPGASAKLGHSAFIALSMLELGQPFDDGLGGLIDGILSLQRPDGSFKTRFGIDLPGGEDYYPGEAMFALMSAHRKVPDERIAAAVRRALPFYRAHWRGRRTQAFVPWQSRAYAALWEAARDREAADFVLEMNDWMIDRYRRKRCRCKSRAFKAGSVLAVHLEGVIQGYHVAASLGDKRRMERYADFIDDAALHLLSLQVKDPDRFGQDAVGGFMRERANPAMRVDRNQHAVIALLEALDLGWLR